MVTDSSLRGILRRITVLFIFLLNCEVTVVSTGMAEIAKAFPSAGPILINLVYTFPILIMVFMNFFIVPPLAKRFNKKSLVLFSLILYLIGGLGGVFATGSIYQIIGMRTFVGLGAGIAAPLCGAIINELYEGNDKKNMLGWANGVDSLVAIVLTLVAGYLCAMKWNYLFYIYSYFFIVILMVAYALPSLPAPVAGGSSENKKVKLSYNGKQKFKLFLVTLYGAVFCIFLVVMMMKLSIFIDAEKIGNAIIASRAIAITTAGIAIGSFFFGITERVFKRYNIIFSAFLVGLGTFVMFKSSAQAPVFMGCIIVGLGAGLNIPLIQCRALAIGVKSDGTFANSMIIGVVNGGQFLATFVEKVVGLFVEPTARNLLGSVSIAMIAICVISLIYIVIDPLKGANAMAEEAVVA
jgi:MFS family permease